MMTFFKQHFPSSKTKFSIYFRTFLPFILGTTLFALNGVVDNFMVGQIEQGVTALSAVNAWTAIMIGWFIGTSAAGSVVTSQFFYDKQYDVVKLISRYRFFLCLIFTIPFFIIAWTNPAILVNVFYKSGDNPKIDQIVYQKAKDYMEIIAFQWVFISITFNLGNQLKETGHGKHTMLWGFGTLAANISLNAILIYGFNMGVKGAAIASVSGRLVAFVWGSVVILKKQVPISYNLFYLFQTNWKIQKLFWSRWVYFISIFSVIFFIVFRGFFYSRAYPVDSLGPGISGPSIMGLSGALMGVFTTTFSALSSMAAVFVGSELGKGNIKQAKINSDELKGFNTLMSACLSVIMFIFATSVPYMPFLSANKYLGSQLVFSSSSQLIHVRNSLYVIAAIYPILIWFSTSFRNGNSGGKGWKFSIVDWVISGPVQLGWLAIISFVIIPNSPTLQSNFAITYFLFFTSDFLKLGLMEWLYYRDTNWLHSITREKSNVNLVKTS